MLSNLNRSNASLLMDDNSWIIDIVTFMKIDHSGIRINYPTTTKGCSLGPKRVAVDGIRIDGLPVERQIDAISKGQRFTWEQQGRLPDCNIAPHGTYLAGAAKAIAQLKAKWATISR